MNIFSHIDAHTYEYIILPIIIFLARICDVTIGTVRIMLVARGRKFLSPLLGFVEMLIWILVIRQVTVSIHNWVCVVAFALGFAVGNFVGMWVEEKLAVGLQIIRIFVRKDEPEIIDRLKKEGYGLTIIDAQGATEKVNLIFSIIKRCDQPKIIKIIRECNPKTFYSIDDIRSVAEGVFPGKKI